MSGVPDDIAEQLRIVVAIPTFQRPIELGRLLAALPAQLASAEEAGRGAFSVSVLVVDNDPARSAEDAVTRLGPPYRYVSEPTRGLDAVRNRAIDESGDERLLIFVDDDEVPRDGWLSALVGFWSRERPAAVAGRVVPTFDSPMDSWLEATGTFARPARRSGEVLRSAATNNLLLDLDVVRRLGLRFDHRLGLSGGEDSLFTEQLRRAGERLLWCDEAVLDDHIPAWRLSRQWARSRAFRNGTIVVAVGLIQSDGRMRRLASRASALGGGVLRLAGGGARRAWGLMSRSTRHDARGARAVWRGAGMVAGATGYVYREYAKRPDAPGAGRAS